MPLCKYQVLIVLTPFPPKIDTTLERIKTFDIGQNLPLDYLFIFIFNCNFQNFRFRILICLILGAFNVF